MNSKKSFKKQNTTVSLKFRFLVTVIVAMLAITVFIGALCLYEVDAYIQKQAKDFVSVTCDNETALINDNLSNMEKSVKIMESYLMDFFKSKSDVTDRALQEQVIANADKMFTDVAKHTSSAGAVAYYFRLDPAISDGKTGLFYSKLEGSTEFRSLEPTDITIYEKDDTEHVGWFWEPYEAGEPVWMKPYHNQNNGLLMISYVMPMYFEDMFIGVVGMDFDYVVLSDMINGIQVYENGFAHLEIDGEAVYNEKRPTLDTDPDSTVYLRTSKKLVNDMTLVLSASYDDIREIRYTITVKILLVVILLAALFIAVAVLVVKKITDPLNKLTDAAAHLSNGDYDVEIAQSDTYEIKMLSMAFENMATHLREREERLHLLANRDSLTGLRNTTSYAAWVSRFDKEIEVDAADFGVVVFDLNDLKETNDKYGHAVGNELIVRAAEVIGGVFANSPVFRIGGDEFLAVLQGDDLANCDKLFDQFDVTCADTFVEEEEVKIPLHIAGGFARFDAEKDLRFSDVFKRADNAMYEKKAKAKIALV